MTVASPPLEGLESKVARPFLLQWGRVGERAMTVEEMVIKCSSINRI